MKDWIEWFWKEMFRSISFAIKQQTLFDYRKYTKLDTVPKIEAHLFFTPKG